MYRYYFEYLEYCNTEMRGKMYERCLDIHNYGEGMGENDSDHTKEVTRRPTLLQIYGKSPIVYKIT